MNPKIGVIYPILLESLFKYMNHEPFQGLFRPQGSTPLANLVEWYVAGAGCLQDPAFDSEFDTAIIAYSLLESSLNPKFPPASSVAMQTTCGLRVVQEFGLATDSEYGAIVGTLPLHPLCPLYPPNSEAPKAPKPSKHPRTQSPKPSNLQTRNP